MTPDQIKRAVLEALADIAPEGNYDQLKPDRPLRDQLDIDSYDFLRVIIGLHEKLGVDIPETDYQKLATLQGALDYLAARLDAA